MSLNLTHLMAASSLAFLFSCTQADETVTMDGEEFRAMDSMLAANRTFVQGDSALATGWYFVVDSGYGFSRRCRGELVYIDPRPIVTAGNVIELDVRPDLSGAADELAMRFDGPGAKRWRVATGKYVKKRLAFVIRDVAMSVPVVQEEIPNGRSSFAPGPGSSTTAEQFGTLVREDMARVPAMR